MTADEIRYVRVVERTSAAAGIVKLAADEIALVSGIDPETGLDVADAINGLAAVVAKLEQIVAGADARLAAAGLVFPSG